MCVTLSEKVRLDKLLQSRKASFSIAVEEPSPREDWSLLTIPFVLIDVVLFPSSNTTLSRFEQLRKAFEPTLVTELGIVTEVIVELPLNKEELIVVTVGGTVMFVELPV